MKKLLVTLTMAFASLSALAAPATNLVINGDFEQTTRGAGQLGYNTNATGWATTGYNFLFAAGSADTTGAVGSYGPLSLWGRNNGGVDVVGDSPTGGNFIGADGGFQVGAIEQTINGLVAGQQYNVSFDWAGAQQSNRFGATTEQWAVSLGNQTRSTAIVNNANRGFTGWMTETFTFTAGSSSEVLSFLAHGTPSGEPPFALLDGVSLTEVANVPEPGTVWNMMIGACGLIAVTLFRRRRADQA